MDRQLQQLLDAELTNWPGVTTRLESGKKHDKLFLRVGASERFVVCQRSTGYSRSLRNTIGEVRRALRASTTDQRKA